MLGVSPEVITHRLSVYKEARPIAQKKRKLGDQKRGAARAEDEKLLKAGFIQEAQYTTWLAMVQKSNGKWWMCTNYTDLNKPCMKEPYQLPSIDRLVDRVARH